MRKRCGKQYLRIWFSAFLPRKNKLLRMVWRLGRDTFEICFWDGKAKQRHNIVFFFMILKTRIDWLFIMPISLTKEVNIWVDRRISLYRVLVYEDILSLSIPCWNLVTAKYEQKTFLSQGRLWRVTVHPEPNINITAVTIQQARNETPQYSQAVY